jgi:Mg/Co/Ni transporter MgtE
MSSNPVTCRMQDDIHEAMNTMSRQQIRRVPIVDEEGRLCGIVAQADIARRLDEHETGEVLEDISQPGGNAISRAFHKTRSSVQGFSGSGQSKDWLVALGVGAAVGAGLMAAFDNRRLAARESSPSEHSRPSRHDGSDERVSRQVY